MSHKNVKRPTYNVIVENIPNYACERDINKIFAPFGEIHQIYIKHFAHNKRACVKYLCEPDAERAVQHCNGFLWHKFVLRVKREIANMNTKNHVGKKFPKNSQSEEFSLTDLSLRNVEPGIIECNASTADSVASKSPSQSGTNLLLSEERELIVTYIENAVMFYGHCVTKREAIHRMSTTLQQTCAALPRLNKTPSHGKVYGALYKGDNLFYRCKVISANYGKAMVRYIDFGNTEEVPFNRIVELPEALRKQPCLAPKCVLTQVSMNETAKNKKSYYLAIEYLQQHILGRTVLITTCSPENKPVFEVTALSCNDKDIIQCLLDENFVSKFEKEKASSYSLSLKNWSYTDDWSEVTQGPMSPSKMLEKGVSWSSSLLSSAKSTEKDALIAEIVDLKEKLEQAKKERSSKEMILDKLEIVAGQIQTVNSFRKKPLDRNYITHVFDMLQSVNSDILRKKKEVEKNVEDALVDYRKCLDSISSACDKISSSNMLEEKKTCENKLSDFMKEYVSLPESLDDGMMITLKATANNLKNQMYTDHDILLDEEPSFLEELISSYGEEENAQESEEVKKKTNKSYEGFMEEFSKIKGVFSLYDGASTDKSLGQLDENKNSEIISQGLFTSNSFLRSLDLLNQALKLEIERKNVVSSREKSKPTVVRCLLNKINSLLCESDRGRIQLHKYSLLLKNLSESESVENKISELNQVKKEIKIMKSKLRHKLVDKKDLEETDVNDEIAMAELDEVIAALLKQLHDAFVHEDFLMQTLATLYETVNPEIEIEYAKFRIAKYAETKGIFKEGWESEHFTYIKLPSRLGLCYRSLFSNELVTLKEFLLETEEKSKVLIERILKWNVFAEHVMPVSAVFRKTERQVYAMTSFMDTIIEAPPTTPMQRIMIVLKVLVCLESLHSANLFHGVTHPSTVLIYEDIVKLDFCFDCKHFLHTVKLNGINYHAPELSKGSELSKATDMYTFGCFTLSILYPHLKFNSTKEGTPNISQHKNKIESELSVSDYSILSSLLCPNPALRVPAMTVLKRGFLKSTSVYCKVSSDISELPLQTCSVSSEAESDNKDFGDSDDTSKFSIDQLSLDSSIRKMSLSSESAISENDKKSSSSFPSEATSSTSCDIYSRNETIDPPHPPRSSPKSSNNSSGSFHIRSDSLKSVDSTSSGALNRLFALRETLKVPTTECNAPKDDDAVFQETRQKESDAAKSGHCSPLTIESTEDYLSITSDFESGDAI